MRKPEEMGQVSERWRKMFIEIVKQKFNSFQYYNQ